MEDYNKIIESLIIRFVRSNALDAYKPVHIKNYYDFQSTLGAFGQRRNAIRPARTILETWQTFYSCLVVKILL